METRLGNARKYKFSQAFIEVQDIKYRLMDETVKTSQRVSMRQTVAEYFLQIGG